jgi:hypothetical protein
VGDRDAEEGFEGSRAVGVALRTLDTLRHEEWKYFDDALVEEAVIRLVGVADLIAAGLVRTCRTRSARWCSDTRR